MRHEYAINPDIAARSSNLQILEPYFDFKYNRVICSFPSSWFKDVLEKSLDMGDLNKLRVIERLNLLKGAKKAFIKSGRDFDVSKSWTDNALFIKPKFFCIVDNHPDCIKIEDVISSHSKFSTQSEWRTLKTLGDFKDIFNKVFECCKTIYIIDPYFSPYTPGCVNLFNHFFELVNNREDKHDVKLKLCISAIGKRKRYSMGEEEKALSDTLERMETQGFEKIEFIIKNEDMHARYLFSDEVCFKADHSFSIDETTTFNVNLTDYETMQHVKKQYFNE